MTLKTVEENANTHITSNERSHLFKYSCKNMNIILIKCEIIYNNASNGRHVLLGNALQYCIRSTAGIKRLSVYGTVHCELVKQNTYSKRM